MSSLGGDELAKDVGSTGEKIDGAHRVGQTQDSAAQLDGIESTLKKAGTGRMSTARVMPVNDAPEEGQMLGIPSENKHITIKQAGRAATSATIIMSSPIDEARQAVAEMEKDIADDDDDNDEDDEDGNTSIAFWMHARCAVINTSYA
jgi:hypothetical protein